MPTNKFKQRNPKNKKTKTYLAFDEESRRDFLSGFQKRKKERKRVARQQQELKYKEEKQKLRQETRKARQAGWKELHFPDEDTEVNDGPSVVYDHDDHTVTIESVGGVTVEAMDLLAAHGGIGENKVEYEDDEDEKKHLSSQLKTLAKYKEEDEDSDEDEDKDDAVEETNEKNSKSQARKKSSILQKLKTKLNQRKSGHKGSSSAKHKGGPKTTSRGVGQHSHRGKKPRGRGRGRGGHGGKQR